MNREPGYYFVKSEADSVTPAEWEIVKFDGVLWECGDSELTDNYFSEINETRILMPDEKMELFAQYLEMTNKLKRMTDNAGRQELIANISAMGTKYGFVRKNYDEKPPRYDEEKNTLHISCYDYTVTCGAQSICAKETRQALGVKPDTFIIITDL